MKKIISFLLVFATCTFGVRAHAKNGKLAIRSNVRAYIDYTPIESYIIDERTYISVDDLVHYGFDVKFDAESMRLYVQRIRFAYPVYTKEMWEEDSTEKRSNREDNK